MKFEVYNASEDDYNTVLDEEEQVEPKAVPFVSIEECPDDDEEGGGVKYEFEIQPDAVNMLQKMTKKKVQFSICLDIDFLGPGAHDFGLGDEWEVVFGEPISQ